MFQVTLSPAGEIRLHLPTGRHLDLGENAESLRYLKRILRDQRAKVRDAPGYIGQFPTQAVIDKWKRQKAEADALAKREAAAAERERLEAELDIDIGALDIDI